MRYFWTTSALHTPPGPQGGAYDYHGIDESPLTGWSWVGVVLPDGVEIGHSGRHEVLLKISAAHTRIGNHYVPLEVALHLHAGECL